MTIAAFVLDIYVMRKAMRRGRYNQMQDVDDKSGFAMDNGAWRTSTEDLVPRAHTQQPAGETSRPKPFGDQRKGPQATEGYALPEEQFGAYDTEYRGGGGLRRSGEAF